MAGDSREALDEGLLFVKKAHHIVTERLFHYCEPYGPSTWERELEDMSVGATLDAAAK